MHTHIHCMMRGICEVNWQGVWERVSQTLMRWDPNMPSVSFGVAELTDIGLTEDGSHILLPIWKSTTPPDNITWTFMKIPIPEIIDMAFSRNLLH